MDPITHAVIGMSVSKMAGQGMDFSNPAYVGVVIGSVFPDIDILLQKWGDYTYLKNHRGTTHSLVGMAVSSILISAALTVLYPGGKFLGILLWTFIGCLSHVGIDLFNTYGAKLFWPILNKRITFNLFTVFDPIFFCTLAGYCFTTGMYQNIFLTFFLSYFTIRILMRVFVVMQLKKKFKDNVGKISILPSLRGLFRWHFVFESSHSNIIGEKRVFRKGVEIINNYKKLHDSKAQKALLTPVGRFFKEFSPLFHIQREKNGEVDRYVFIDMRYYMRNKFMHHGILEFDKNGCVVTSSFNPYNMERVSHIPENGRVIKNRFLARIVDA